MAESLRGTAIVVGVEDADESRDAAALGLRIAHASQAAFHLVTAVHDPWIDIGIARLGFEEQTVREALTNRALESVRERLREAVPPEVLRDQLSVVLGRPEHVLEEYARRQRAELIVVGGKAKSGVISRFAGRTAHHLLRMAGCPLLVTAPGALEIARVMVALDLSGSGARTLSVATELAGILDVDLEAVHVVDNSAATMHRALPFDADQITAAGEALAEERIRPLLDRDTGLEVLSGPVPETLARASVERGPTLLVMGSHGLGRVSRWMIGSTTETLLTELPASLVVVPSTPHWA